MKVYVITSGSYSDYNIEAVFLSKEKAEEFVNDFNRVHQYDSAEIEEFEADQPIEIRFAIDVRMMKNGDVLDTRLVFNPSKDSIGFSWFSSPYHLGDSFMQWCVATDDVQTAIKVVNEKRTIILSHNLWMNEKGVKELFSKLQDSGSIF